MPELGTPSARFRALAFRKKFETDGDTVAFWYAWPARHSAPGWARRRGGRFLWNLWAVPTRLLTWLPRILLSRRFDATVLLRDLGPEPWPILESLLTTINRRVIYDFDDAVYTFPWRVGEWRARRQEAKIRNIVASVHSVIAGNEHLAAWARRLNSRAAVVPTAVDTEKYRPPPSGRSHNLPSHLSSPSPTGGVGKRLTVGWIGTSSNLRYLEKIASALAKICTDFPHAEILIVTDRPESVWLEGCRTRVKRFEAESELADFQSLDIGLMPLEQSEWTNGKCAFKALMYMACGVSPVCSDVGANREVIEHGVNGFLAGNPEDWSRHLADLIKSADLRRRMGEAARRTVVEKFSVECLYPRLRKIVREVAGLHPPLLPSGKRITMQKNFAKHRLKVCHVIEPTEGGAPKQVALSLRGLNSEKFELTLIAPDRAESGPLADLPPHVKRIRQTFAHEIAPRHDFRTFLGLFIQFLKERPDIVHTHSSKAGFLGRWAAGLAGVRKIYYTPHGFSFLRTDVSPFKRGIFLWLEKLCGVWTTGVIAVSHSEALEAEKVVPGHKIFVNPNGIPISPVSSSPLQGEGTTVLRVGTAGRMTAAKGPQVFFNIAKELTERRQDVRFVWIGGEKNEASGEIVNRDVVNRGSRMTSGVEVTGWLAPEETLKKMAELDIFLMTSEWEGLPYALLEAMSLGKPAVVMNRYGMAEVVQHGETGFTANTPEEAVRYLEKLLDDTALRTWMGKAARETVEEKFSEKRMVEELEKIYGHAGEVRSEGNTRVAADRQR